MPGKPIHYRAETILENLRKYGNLPYKVAVVHGGPGAPGEMAPVARELSRYYGVLEPLQTAATVEGQVEELRNVLEKYGDKPLTLIGHSWGAWLSIIFAARYPAFVKKLILVGSGPLEEEYASRILETRFNRMSREEALEVRALTWALGDPQAKDKKAVFARFGKLMSKIDSYDPIPSSEEKEPEFQDSIYQSVWAEADDLRHSGELMKLTRQIRRPVVAIHGDYDPHPSEGVEIPLRQTVTDFRFILLKNCGHEPWAERKARARFYQILVEELA